MADTSGLPSESVFLQLLEHMEAKIGMLDLVTPAQKSVALSQLEGDLLEAERILQALSTEITASKKPNKTSCKALPSIQLYQKRLKTLQRAILLPSASSSCSMSSSETNQSSERPASRGFTQRQIQGQASPSSGHKSNAVGMGAHSSEHRSIRQLKESKAAVANMEELGNSILENLHKQRETIQNSRGKMAETNEQVTQSEKIVKRMGSWLRTFGLN
mmetsp:Transcript_29942/g.36353  ORF Transcript_29942/g.36353 Transcript_29942/m.36353 type:complete len:217 (-) Transcript_29942:402-1052(-)|eukprot:CAMPEP_0197857868 /NCGR_PEP_ID=MMETSP1438-20131217/31281_1 /TAXON_ID=1461541 /ORGANISM="Pterosperma sp., Strain CCMP1384" /LENGTH=216 /DNA_ID=CAMNT_0043473851 /DNA_START=207 /DNA_END=857 /DNA_ORIENTATION=-